MDLSRLKAQRSGHRGAATRILKKLEECTEDTDTETIQTLIDTLKKKQEVIKRIDEEIIEIIPTEDMENEICETDEYNIDLENNIRKYKKICNSFNPTSVETSNSTLRPNAAVFTPTEINFNASSQLSRSSFVGNQNHRLPKLSLPKFSGNILEWQYFWDSFESSIHNNCSLTDVQKFSYLQSSLEFEAANVINGITLTNANYHKAVELLKNRYGQEHKLVNAYMKALLDLDPPRDTLDSMRNFHDRSEAYIRGMESLGQCQEMYGSLLVPVILDKLPTEVRKNITRENGGDNWNICKLRNALSKELTIQEASCANDNKFVSNSKQEFTTNFHTAAISRFQRSRQQTSQYNGNQKLQKTCVLCGKDDHIAVNCTLSHDEKINAVKRKQLCFNCLGNHRVVNCKTSKNCKKCCKRHHTALCNSQTSNASNVPVQGKNKKENTFHVSLNENDIYASSATKDGKSLKSPKPESISETALFTTNARQKSVLLKTAIGSVASEYTTEKTNILFDEGAQRSFLTEKCAEKLKLQITGSETLNIAGFGGKEVTRHVKTATVYLLCDSGEKVPINVVIVPTIAAPLHINYGNVQYLPYLRGLKFAHPSSLDMSFEISLLVGADHYWDIVGDKVVRGNGLTAVSSKLGYLLSGPSNTENDVKSTTVYNILTYHANEEVDLEKFWRCEEMCNSEKQTSEASFIKDSISYEGNRYVAKLPWKEDCVELPTNENIARKRTENVIHRLARDRDLLRIYDSIIQDQENRGFIEKVESENKPNGSRIHYIPHHPVSKDSTTTPIRVVYDCSCRANYNSPSLNDCLKSTPPQLNNLTAVLTKFRANKFAVTADIEKAFLQIGIHESDRDATRFFWLSDVNDANSQLIEYRFKVVLFGATCSPFLLDAVLRKHFADNPSETAEELSKTLYVDNVLTSFVDEETLMDFYENSRKLLQNGGFKLREFNSNNVNLRGTAKTDHILDTDKLVKILGLRWNSESDSILFQKTNFNADNVSEITKREVLSKSSKIFDPLGLLSPVTVSAKILIQDIWKANLTWDEPLPGIFQERWISLANELEQSTYMEFPRYLKSGSIAGESKLHVFTDASLRVYGSNAYLVTGNTSNLVMAKNRLAPMKTTTLPRMELMGAVTGANLANHLISVLDVKSVVFWCDSQIVLNWIMSDKTLGKFVMNQKMKIRDLTESIECTWRYVPTNDNPADLQTRGITANDLRKNSLWMHGPTWITDSSKWPEWNRTKTVTSNDDEKTRDSETSNFVTETSTVPGISNVMEIARFGSLGKLLRVTAYVLRFIDNCRNTRIHQLRQNPTDLSKLEQIRPTEVTTATKLWITDVQDREFSQEKKELKQNKKTSTLIKQLKLYLHDDVIKCKGRIDNSSVMGSAKNPILLPKKHIFTELVVRDIHQRSLHAGTSQTVAELRQAYWIPSIRQCVNRVLKSCVKCQKVLNGHYKLADPPQLPTDRVEECVPFSVTGIDYAGPLYVKENGGTTKVYICLFTCATSRAVHLELVTDLSTESFLLAFRRFVSINGSPSTIYSDNATTFVAANKEIFNNTGIYLRWKFIPKGAPWHGGFWERLIGITKITLKKVLGKALVSLDTLRTLLSEISAVIKDRPLTFVSSNFDDVEPLTPSHLLRGRRKGVSHLFEIENNSPIELDATSANRHYKRKHELLKHFMGRWKTEYLTRLREYHLGHGGKDEMEAKVGDIVQVEDNTPRMNWKLGIVTELFTGNDGHVRSVNLRTGNGFITSRPVTKLYPLEL